MLNQSYVQGIDFFENMWYDIHMKKQNKIPHLREGLGIKLRPIYSVKFRLCQSELDSHNDVAGCGDVMRSEPRADDIHHA